MNNNWKPAIPQLNITPEIEHAINISQTDKLREQLQPKINQELLKHNKIDTLIEHAEDQKILLVKQLKEQTETNQQLKEEKLMLEGKLDTFKEQNEELRNQNQQLNSQLQEAIEKAGKPNWIPDILIGVGIFLLCELIEFIASNVTI